MDGKRLDGASFNIEVNKSASCKIDVILFDLGNVLIDFDHMPAVEKIRVFTNKTLPEIFQLFF